MMRYKAIKMLLVSVLLASLTACANKNNDINNNITGPRNVSTGDLKRNLNVYDPDRNGILTNRNMDGSFTARDWNGTNDNKDLNRTNGNLNVTNQGPLFSGSEIQPMNYGFITIDPNSYSTTLSSSQFPHTKKVQQGQYWYYTFYPEIRQTQTGLPQRAPNGIVTPPQANKPGTSATTPAQQSPALSSVGVNQFALQVIQLTNNERRKNGLSPLKTDIPLSKVAQIKTNDMYSKHYFSHTSPTYGSPFDMMRDFGAAYRSAGENIAMGQTTAQQVVTAWMNSEGHRKNILNPNFTNIGVGYNAGGKYWSQMFIAK